jgi:ribosomal protein S18 acetylase RimI-like enzyme
MDVRIETGGHWPDAVERLLRGLPEWFGMEQPILDYIEAARSMPSTAAVVDGEVVAVCLVRHHTPVAAEIDLLAVQRDFHRLGIGRRILDRVVADLRSGGVRLLQVKTFGPSGSSVEYERTRAFYEAVGFLPIEERTDIWGPENPCLILVKPLD